jgi:hypothetical protein
MKTADKLLTSLVTLHNDELKNSLAYKDSRILFSLCKTVNGDSFITENQSKLLIKIFKENKNILSKLDDEFQSIIDNPTWSQPFRPQDTTKKLYTSKVDDDNEVLVIEFAFSSTIRKKITSFTKQVTGLVQAQNGRMFYAEYTEKNIVKLVEDLKEFNFDIEEKLMDFYKTIKSWEKSTFINQFMLTNITHDNFQKQITADLGINTSIDQNIIKDRSIRYQYFTEKSNFDENLLTEHVANRRTTKVWVNRMTTSFDSLVKTLIELKRLPVLLVFDAFSSKTCANELKEISEILEKNGISDKVGIYFRLENSEDGKEFNQLIKDKKYNCQLTPATNVVGVQSGKIPKFLLKTDWKPMSVIFIGTSLRNSKTAVYASNCDLVIAYTDKEPIIEAKAMWE